MQNPFEFLKLSDLQNKEVNVLREPSSTRPALWVVEEKGRRAVIKDFSRNGIFFRKFIGRFLVWREEKAYRKLRGLRGVPGFFRVMDGPAIVIEELRARSVEGLEREKSLSKTFFLQLRELVERIHNRGLAHCDLKRAPNILLGQDNMPYIVDWSSAISEREFRYFPMNLIYKRFMQDDLNAIVKLQLKHCPGAVSPEDKRRYFLRGPMEKLLRSLRDRARTMLQKIT